MSRLSQTGPGWQGADWLAVTPGIENRTFRGSMVSMTRIGPAPRLDR